MSIKSTLDPRMVRTRRFLRDALISLIDEKGFDALTVGDLTKRADINRTTFYLHYKDKYELLEYTMGDLIKGLIEATKTPLVGQKPKTIMEFLPKFFLYILNHIADNKVSYQVLLGKNMVPKFAFLLERTLEKIYAKSSYLFPNNSIEPSIMLESSLGAHMGVIKYWLYSELKYSPQYLAEQMAKLTYYGLDGLGIEMVTEQPK